MVFVSLGYEPYLTREIAHRPARMHALVSSAITMRLLLAVSMMVLLACSLFLIDISALGKLVVMIQGLALFSSAISLICVYQGLQRMHVAAGRETLASFCNLLGTLLLVHGPADLPIAACVSTGVFMLTHFLVFVQYARDFGWPSIRISRRLDFAYASRSMDFFWVMLMITVTYNTPIVVLGLIRTDEEVGLFAAGWKLLALAITAPTVISALFLPRLARLTDHYSEKSREAGLLMETILIFTIPLTLLGIALAPQILLVLFGPQYLPATDVVALLLLNGLVVSVNITLNTPLMAGRRQKESFRIVATGAVTGVVLNVALIPFWGATGAALAILIDEIVILALLVANRPEVPVRATLSFALRCLAAVIPAGFAAHFATTPAAISASPIAAFGVGGVIGAGVYLAMVWVLRVDVVRLATGLRRMR
jgi:O-antigen/teichoic acid export membrane protein